MESQEQLISILVYGIIFVVLLTTGLMLFFYYSRKKITEKEQEKTALKLKNQEAILAATIATQEEERKRIAQDLHDAISSKLNVISLTTNSIIENENCDDIGKKSLMHIVNINDSVLASARKIAHDLLPPILEKFGLKAALEELIDDYEKASTLQILHTIESIAPLEGIEELHIFRIVQELINNAFKHGEASQMAIHLVANDRGFKLDFNDNGKGFIPEALGVKIGIGLQNIKSRATILNCEFHIESAPGKGSTFIIQSK